MRANQLLSENAVEVLQLLMAFLQAPGSHSEQQSQVFRCLLSWIKSNEITSKHLMNHPIVPVLFQALRSEDFFEVACDALCQVIKEAGDLQTNGALADKVLTGLAQIHDLLEECKADDDERQRGLCRVFAEAGEQFLPLLTVGDGARYHQLTQGIPESMFYPYS